MSVTTPNLGLQENLKLDDDDDDDDDIQLLGSLSS
jgi:hypothetical protein